METITATAITYSSQAHIRPSKKFPLPFIPNKQAQVVKLFVADFHNA
jgi:hypothetical protein